MPEDLPVHHVWDPDCLDRLLGCWKRSPQTKAATGYYLLRIIYSVITVHSAVIFAGVITYSALKVTNCISEDSDSSSCGTKKDVENDDSLECTKLWGIIKPDSLLTVIGTASAIVLALSAALVGTAMDVTSYRRQIGLAGNIFMIIGMIMCLSLLEPTETTLIISSIGLIIILIFKDFVSMQLDSYGPELSAIPAEIGSAISGGFTWSLISNVLLIIVWSIVGMGMSNDTYGFVVTIGSVVMMLLLSVLTYRRLPDVPAAHVLTEEDVSLTQYTFRCLYLLIGETYRDYPDLGILILSGMIFDPALSSLFAAAVLILISKYEFSSNQVTYLLGIAIVAAIPAVPLSRWIASTSRLNWLFRDDQEKLLEEDDAEGPVGGELEASYQHVDDTATEVELVVIDPEREQNKEEGSTECTTAPDIEKQGDSGACSSFVEDSMKMPASTTSNTTSPTQMSVVKLSRFHPHRIRCALIAALGLTVINTILVVQILNACNIILAGVFSCIWGFLLSFCWNCLNMLRMAIVPGGRESEFAGLYLALYSGMIWLPLFVFSVANEVWSIDGALYVLNIFFGLGALVLLFMQMDRALAARLSTLSQRRWAHGVGAGGSSAAAEHPLPAQVGTRVGDRRQ